MSNDTEGWEQPGPGWSPKDLQQLLELLVSVYDERREIKRIVELAGLDWRSPPGRHASMEDVWIWALNQAGGAGLAVDENLGGHGLSLTQIIPDYLLPGSSFNAYSACIGYVLQKRFLAVLVKIFINRFLGALPMPIVIDDQNTGLR